LVRIWDSEGGVTPGLLQGHEGPVISVAFSSDGRRIMSGSSDMTVRVWNTETFEELLRKRREFVSCVAYSPDGRQIAIGGHDSIRIWDAKTLSQQAFFQHEGEVNAFAFSPDGRRVVSGSWDGTVRVWGLTGAQIQRVSHEHEFPVRWATLSPDGRRIVTNPVGLDPSRPDRSLVPIWESESGRFLGFLRGHESAVASVAFSPDSQRVVTGAFDWTVRVWDAETLEELLVAFGDAELGLGDCVTYSPDGQRIASGGKNAVGLWDAETGAELIVLCRHDIDDQYFDLVRFSPDGKYLAAVGIDLVVWNLETGANMAGLQGVRTHERDITEVAFARNGPLIRCWFEDGTECVWDVRTGKRIEGGEAAATTRVASGLPWRAIPHGIETVFEPSTGGAPVAWFPMAFWEIEAHPNGRLWVGTHSFNLYIIRLEGDEDWSVRVPDSLRHMATDKSR